MDKPEPCNPKTVNLAKEKCIKKTNFLVYEKSKVPPPRKPMSAYAIPPISALPAKQIRVCTGAELKKMCPPKLCDCPPRPPPIGIVGRLMKVCGFGLKAAVAGGLVYWTWDQGVWGDSEKTQELYTNWCKTMNPGKPKARGKLSEKCEAEQNLMIVPPPPPPGKCSQPPIDCEKSTYSMQESWNSFIVQSFTFVSGFPGNIQTWYSTKSDTDEADRKCPTKTK